MTTFQDYVANLVSAISTNWNAGSGGTAPSSIVQGQSIQFQDLQNKEFVLVFGTTNTIKPFDFKWASRLRDQSILVQCITGTSRARLIQIVSEVLRIMLAPGLFTTNQVNITIDAMPDLSQATRMWFQMNIEATAWIPESN